MVAGFALIDLDRPAPMRDEVPSLVRTRPALLVVLLAALLALGGAAPEPAGLTPVLMLDEPVTAVQLGARSFYLGTPTEIRRYDLPGGAPRWVRSFDPGVLDLRLDESAGILLVVSSREPRITTLDAGSGRVLWSEDAGETIVVSTSRGAVLTQAPDGDGARFRLVDAATGREVWTRDVDSTGFLGPDGLFDQGSSWIVAVGSTGEAVVLDYADGTVLARGQLGPGFAPSADQSVLANFVEVSVLGDRLYVSRRLRGRSSLTAYAVRQMTRLWQAEGGPIGMVTDCGRVLCVADTRWVNAVDPADGRVLWDAPAWGIAYRYDDRRLFAYDNHGETEAALIDEGSGRVLRELGHSRQVGDLIMRTEGRDTWVFVPDRATGGLRMSGVVRDAAWFRCAAHGDYLMCPTFRGETGLWRVR
jgi:outer membrane protein assembly factor BamB